jgi:hypothetical protein
VLTRDRILPPSALHAQRTTPLVKQISSIFLGFYQQNLEPHKRRLLYGDGAPHIDTCRRSFRMAMCMQSSIGTLPNNLTGLHHLVAFYVPVVHMVALRSAFEIPDTATLPNDSRDSATMKKVLIIYTGGTLGMK